MNTHIFLRQITVTITHRTHNVVAHGSSAVNATGKNIAEKDHLVIIAGFHHLDYILEQEGREKVGRQSMYCLSGIVRNVVC